MNEFTAVTSLKNPTPACMTTHKTVSLEVPAEFARQLSQEFLFCTLSLLIKPERRILGILEVSELCKVGELLESYEFASSFLSSWRECTFS